MDRIHLVPQPGTVVYEKQKIVFLKAVSVTGLSPHAPEQRRTIECLTNLLTRFSDVSFDFDGNHPFLIQFIRKDNLPTEGYELVIKENGVTIYAKTMSGEFYGTQTLYQILAFSYWGSNDIAGRLISLYGGADYAWTPETPECKENDDMGESLRSEINIWMRKWQTIFPDAADNILNTDRGPQTLLGKYVWPPMANKYVAPTGSFKPE